MISDPAVKWLETSFAATRIGSLRDGPYLKLFHPITCRMFSIEDQESTFQGLDLDD